MRGVGYLVGVVLVLMAVFACRPREEARADPGAPAVSASGSGSGSASASAPASSAPAVPADTPVKPTARLVHLPGSDDPNDPTDFGLAVDGLPAVSDDGTLVAAVAPDEGIILGIRPYFVAIDPSADRVVRTTRLVTPAEARALVDLQTGAAPQSAAADKKTADVTTQANVRLAELQAWLDARTWRHLAELDVPENSGAHGTAAPGRDPAAGVTVDFDAVHVVERAPGGAVLFDRSFPAWVPPVRRLPPPMGNECHFAPHVSGAAVDATRGILLVQVSQAEVGGGDFCNEPTSVHAFRTRNTAIVP